MAAIEKTLSKFLCCDCAHCLCLFLSKDCLTHLKIFSLRLAKSLSTLLMSFLRLLLMPYLYTYSYVLTNAVAFDVAYAFASMPMLLLVLYHFPFLNNIAYCFVELSIVQHSIETVLYSG